MPWIKTQNITGPQGPQGPTGPFSRIPGSDLDLYVAPDGSDSEGDGSQTNPWATPQRAMEELWGFLIPPDRTATVHIADGDYTLVEPLRLDHPSGARITLSGGTVSGSKPDATQLSGLNAQAYTPESAAANEAVLKGYYNTRLCFPQTTGLQLRLGSGITLEKLLLIGSRSQVGVELASNTAISLAPSGDFALHNWSAAIQGAGSFSSGGLSISNCYQGVFASAGNSSLIGCLITNTERALNLKGSAVLFAADLRLQYGDRGISVLDAASLECYSTSLQSLSGDALALHAGRISGGLMVDTVKTGVQLYGGSLNLTASRFSHCSDAGLRMTGGSFSGFSNDITDTPIGASVMEGALLTVDQLRFERCSNTALVVDNAQALVYASRFIDCNQGITCRGGRVNAKSASFSNTTGLCLNASRGGFIDYENGSSSTPASPAFNTSGNGNAFILL
ncbi:right-handed parallel beta-helix repeat-containing protein [Vulcanococcus sp.]|jgi:hypothetical protein|uniref:right-handed parallel beta-helix repeat-containing protein n=1 Tax=Vulcanococcus sp. TaxID=2856995 RepID=UPI0037D9EE4C